MQGVVDDLKPMPLCPSAASFWAARNLVLDNAQRASHPFNLHHSTSEKSLLTNPIGRMLLEEPTPLRIKHLITILRDSYDCVVCNNCQQQVSLSPHSNVNLHEEKVSHAG